MNQTEVANELRKVKNIAKFSADSCIPVRTLWRIIREEGPSTTSTLKLVELQLKRIKPKRKEEVAS